MKNVLLQWQCVDKVSIRYNIETIKDSLGDRETYTQIGTRAAANFESCGREGDGIMDSGLATSRVGPSLRSAR